MKATTTELKRLNMFTDPQVREVSLAFALDLLQDLMHEHYPPCFDKGMAVLQTDGDIRHVPIEEYHDLWKRMYEMLSEYVEVHELCPTIEFMEEQLRDAHGRIRDLEIDLKYRKDVANRLKE